ncbi:MAG: maleylpyruvate isomerase N-terminal domain-containing protein [Actinomycetota bacterium]
MNDRRAELLADENAAWNELHDLVERVPLDACDDPTLPAEWSVNDVLFHVGAWLADCANEFERMGAGTFVPSDESSDGQNAAWLEVSRGMDAQGCRAQFESGHSQMLHHFGDLREIDPHAIEWFEESGPMHYRAHAPDLRAWLAERGL